jgi:aspartate carbamoyltransferase
MPKIVNSFYNKSFISIDQITYVKQIKYLFKVADGYKECVKNHKICEDLKGYTVSVLFYQPSTRTFTSFVAAAKRLGAYVIDIHGMSTYSSAVKGEALEDTIKTINQTTASDAIVMRHPDNFSSKVASSVSKTPMINGGSGKAEHPTQALLDLYTIYSKFGRMDNLNIVMAGDLKYGRTIKSLAKLLSLVGKNNKITFVAPKELAAPRDLVEDLSKKVAVVQKQQFGSSLKVADVLYMTRVQKEWFEAENRLDKYESLKHKYIITRHMAGTMKKDAIILHPLPRVGEILYEVDKDPRAWYFKQMRSGLYIRMALLKSILIK